MLVVVYYVLAEFTYSSETHRRASIYKPHCKPILSITSISPWLVSSTMFMIKRPHLRYLCVFEWIHCLLAALHHALQYDFIVYVAGMMFLVWGMVMVNEKQCDLARRESVGGKSAKVVNCTHLSIASTLLYLHLWKQYGEVFVLSGAGPMTSQIPFIYTLLHCGDMQLRDYFNCTFLGLLFLAENGINMLEEEGSGIHETASQVIHLAGHVGISYFIYDLNRRHFFGMKREL